MPLRREGTPFASPLGRVSALGLGRRARRGQLRGEVLGDLAQEVQRRPQRRIVACSRHLESAVRDRPQLVSLEPVSRTHGRER